MAHDLGLSTAFLKRLIRAGEIPAVMDRPVKIRKADLDNYATGAVVSIDANRATRARENQMAAQKKSTPKGKTGTAKPTGKATVKTTTAKPTAKGKTTAKGKPATTKARRAATAS